ncbi:MAG: response regulator [Verrucomicrobiota bacterium]|jgi:CheY-like chemotaxis protein
MRRILLVEDDVLIARIYRRKLEDAGFYVLVAEDGVVAIKLVREFEPDLVVLDLIIPKLSGSDVLKFIRQQEELKAIPVVVFSNAFMTRPWDQIAALGVQGTLDKSAASPPQLIEIISRILEQPAASAPMPGPALATRSTPEKVARPAGAPASSPPATRESRPLRRSESPAEFRSRMRRDFFEQTPAISKSFQVLCRNFLESPDTQVQLRRVGDLQRKIGFLTHMTSMAGCYRIAQLSSAFEALLFELQFKPASITHSARQTVSSASELLADCLARADQPDEQCLSPTTVLVVDDDAVSSRALVVSLARSNLTATAVSDPFQALEKLRQNSYDVALLDINLPGISGITLCQEMRKLPLHAKTPVIFVTSYAEFEPQARAILNGGDDLISKPIMPVELTVKIIVHLLKHRLENLPTPH